MNVLLLLVTLHGDTYPAPLGEPSPTLTARLTLHHRVSRPRETHLIRVRSVGSTWTLTHSRIDPPGLT